MRKLLAILMVTLFIGSLYAQKRIPSGGNISQRNCGTMEYTEMLKKNDPTYASRLNDVEKFVQNYVANHPEELNKAVITVPVVVHILYKTTVQNIADARVTEQIAILNTDFAGQNVHGMGLFSTSLKANTELQFCLANVDPEGNPTTGITRTATTISSFTTGSNMKYTSQGGHDAWNTNQYMNVWVCNLGGGLCGFAEFPTNPLSNTFGVVIHYAYFGLTSDTYYNLGGTTSHEIGHCFTLYHTWGDENGCTGTDYCNDVPNEAEAYTQGVPPGNLYTDACTTTSPGVMWTNFMDYTFDIGYSNFTPNQKSRIQASFASGGPLYQLGHSTKCAPIALSANFSANKTTISKGGSVIFTSSCTGTPTSYTWTFAGGTPSSKTGVGPHTIQYNTSGTYTATLKVTDGTTEDTEIKTNYITVIEGSDFTLNFESSADFATTFLPWTVNDVDGKVCYSIEDGTPPYVVNFPGSQTAFAYMAFNPASTTPPIATGYEPHGGVRFGASIAVDQQVAVGDNNDWLISPKIRIGATSQLKLWVRSITDAAGLERYKIGVSTTTNAPASFTFISTSPYEEAPITWTEKTYSLASYSGQQAYIGINCVSHDAFMFMIDDILISDIILGVNDIPNLQNVNIYPNPAAGYAYVSGVGSSDVTVELYDMFGKLQNTIVSNQSTNLMKIDLNGLAKGVYVVKINTPQGEKVEKLLVY